MGDGQRAVTPQEQRKASGRRQKEDSFQEGEGQISERESPVEKKKAPAAGRPAKRPGDRDGAKRDAMEPFSSPLHLCPSCLDTADCRCSCHGWHWTQTVITK